MRGGLVSIGLRVVRLTVTFLRLVEGGQPQRATEIVYKIYLNPDVFLFRFNSGYFDRGRLDAMLCGRSKIYLFGCLRVRMFKKRGRRVDLGSQ